MNYDAEYNLNQDNLDDVLLKMNNDIDTIMSLLHDIQMKVHDTSEYFTGDVADTFRDNFERYSNQFEKLKDNLNSYVQDLINVKSMINKVDIKNASIMTEAQESTQQTIGSKHDETKNNGDLSLDGIQSTYTQKGDY